jgi:hypothetical protein
MDISNNTKQYILLPILYTFLFFNYANADERIKEFDEEKLEEQILFADPKNIYSDNKSDELIATSSNYDLILEPEEIKKIIDFPSLKESLLINNNKLLSKESLKDLNEYGFIKFNNIDQLFLIDGTIIINFKNFPDLNNFASENDIVFKSSFPSINSASFKIKKITDLEDVVINLKNNSNINSVTIDYRDHRLGKE